MKLMKLVLFVCLLLNCYSFARESMADTASVIIGTTYSYPHSLWLFGNNEVRAKAVLDDVARLGTKHFRLEAYWNWIQKDSSGQLDLTSLEWQLEIMARCNAGT